jgi:hypothetical protein
MSKPIYSTGDNAESKCSEKEKLCLYSIKHHSMKTYRELEVYLHLDIN